MLNSLLSPLFCLFCPALQNFRTLKKPEETCSFRIRPKTEISRFFQAFCSVLSGRTGGSGGVP
jgi:hypothetical protein